ncbi:MAG TPA: hypothetical protein DCE44_04390 [Verrucomicrobiales bacterium]|nr:hypothetical protein [Verrucomicrobiales bacterium]
MAGLPGSIWQAWYHVVSPAIEETICRRRIYVVVDENVSHAQMEWGQIYLFDNAWQFAAVP